MKTTHTRRGRPSLSGADASGRSPQPKIPISEELLRKGKALAERRGTTFSALVRQLLEEEVDAAELTLGRKL